MDVALMVDALEVQGRLLAEVAGRTGQDSLVPSCPEWTVADLLRHVGEVHRWAAAIVASAAPEELDSSAQVGRLPGDQELPQWLLTGHATLVAALRAAAADLDCWTFLPAPTALAFWARRQLHETSVHRMDVELAVGQAISPVPPWLAEDGIDEIVAGLVPRAGSRLRCEQPRSLLIAPNDSPARWWVGITEGPPCVVREQRPADAVLRGDVGALYQALWNRPAPVTLDGDAGVLELWRARVRIRWS